VLCKISTCTLWTIAASPTGGHQAAAGAASEALPSPHHRGATVACYSGGDYYTKNMQAVTKTKI